MGADTKASGGGGGALERGHGAALEPLAQLGDALVSDEVAGETAREGGGGGIASMPMGADTKANTSGVTAHSRLVI